MAIVCLDGDIFAAAIIGLYIGYEYPAPPLENPPSRPSPSSVHDFEYTIVTVKLGIMAARTAAILSPGDMGSGLGRLLRANLVRVITNLEGRSPRSQELAKSNGIEDVGSDSNILKSADIIISVLVPSSARATAERIITASKALPRSQQRTKFYIDANAISPKTVRSISELFNGSGIEFIDGSIIGGPPKLQQDGMTWYRPTFALSGARTRELDLDYVFDIAHVGPDIGQASALKMSFASLTKGFVAIAIQSLGTAAANGLLEALFDQLKKHNPIGLARLQSLTVMPPKAYRWVGEMEEISNTFADEGFDPQLFLGAAETYRWIADDTELGKEIVERREKGKDVEDVCKWIVKALKENGKKLE